MPNHFNNSFPTDKASARYYSYFELFLSKIKLLKFFNKITVGKAVIISKNVEIKITDNGKLILGDHTVIAKDASIILTKPKPLIEISRNVLIGNGSLIFAKKKSKLEKIQESVATQQYEITYIKMLAPKILLIILEVQLKRLLLAKMCG